MIRILRIFVVFLVASIILQHPNISLSNLQEENLHKIDPVLKRFIRGSTALLAPPKSIDIEKAQVKTILKISGNVRSIEVIGAKIHSVIGDIVTADVPINAIADIANIPQVSYIQAQRQLQLLLDKSVPDTKANQAWNSVPGYTGKDVIVGIIDSGIDWNHEAFKNEDGSTRILYIWDTTIDTPTQYPRIFRRFGYGTEWTHWQIDAGMCTEMDVDGHGTHVASIAAGNNSVSDNRQSDPRFTGVAPEADIIVVKSRLFDGEILDAVKYIFDKAAEEGKPAVINMSFGSQYGPHDGRELLDKALNRLLLFAGAGNAIVVSAGNSGDELVHVGGRLPAPIGDNYLWTAFSAYSDLNSISIEIWYKSTDELSIRLLLPVNKSNEFDKYMGGGWVPEGESKSFIVSKGPLRGALVTVDAEYSLYPDLNYVYLEISCGDDVTIPIDDYIYGVEYDGEGVYFDAYIQHSGQFESTFNGKMLLIPGDSEHTVASPGSASDVITVGSYVTKNQWIDVTGAKQQIPDAVFGHISTFSSHGPLLNGDLKPDLAAPGEFIVAALSHDGWAKSQLIEHDRRYQILRGTSMAAPHVTGAVALLLQQQPNLNAYEIKQILINAGCVNTGQPTSHPANAIDKEQSGWDAVWGYGQMDILAALGLPSIPKGLKADEADSAIELQWLPNPENDIAGYKIYQTTVVRGLNPRTNVVDVGNVTSYRFIELPNDVPLSFSITAYDNAGNESGKSDALIATPHRNGIDITPPAPPTLVSAIALETGVQLSWQANSENDVEGYKIYYGNSAGDYRHSVDVSNQTNYRINNLVYGVTLYITVSAYDVHGNESDKSAEVKATPLEPPTVLITEQQGWPLSVKERIYSSPVVGDIDRDGDYEVIIGTNDKRVYAWHHDGSSVKGFPVSTDGAVISSPALADINEDGMLDIVVGSGQFVYAWRYNGTLLPGWPVSTSDAVISSPALADIDGDGQIDVVVGSKDGSVYAWNHEGKILNRFPVRTGGYIYSSPAVGDIDKDGDAEIVVGSEDGKIYVWHHDGTRFKGFPRNTQDGIYSSPALADLDGDEFLEIIVGSKDQKVYAWLLDGSLVAGFPVRLKDAVYSSPAIGDIDGDGAPEIICGGQDGNLYAWHSDGTLVDGFPTPVANTITASAVIGDIDGDGDNEIIVGGNVGDGYAGFVSAVHHDGQKVKGFPIAIEGSIDTSGALSDIDGDGDIEIIISSWSSEELEGFQIHIGQIHAWDMASVYNSSHIEWGMFHHNPRHTGVYKEGAPSPPSYPPWDINQDGIVDIFDLSLVGQKYGQLVPPNSNVDVNGDGNVNILDLVIVGQHFGEEYKKPTESASTYSGKELPPAQTSVITFVPAKLRLEPSRERINMGHEYIQLQILVDSINDVYGFQFDLAFNAQIFESIAVTEGSLSREGGSSYWHKPRIDNKAGKIIGAAVVGLATNQGMSKKILARLTFKVKNHFAPMQSFGKEGNIFSENEFILQNVKLVDRNGHLIPVQTETKHFRLEEIIVPKKTIFFQNYPNPFNLETWIPFQLAKTSEVNIEIYNIRGELVQRLPLGRRKAGVYVSKERAAYWDGKNQVGEKVASGVYFYLMEAGKFRTAKKMVILK